MEGSPTSTMAEGSGHHGDFSAQYLNMYFLIVYAFKF